MLDRYHTNSIHVTTFKLPPANIKPIFKIIRNKNKMKKVEITHHGINNEKEI